MATPTATTSRPTGRRVAYWDNARFLCITLVVIGHAIQRLASDSDTTMVLYLTIYAFHMPALAIISGRFSSSRQPDKKHMTRIVTDLLIPYLLLEGIWSLVQFFVSGTRFNPTTPSWTLWFLLALAVFRVALPYLALTRFPLTIAVIMSVSVGYFSNVDTTFSLSRVIGLLPFFVIGWKLRTMPRIDAWVSGEKSALWMRLIAIAIVAAAVVTLAVFLDTWRSMDLYQWFFYRDSYRELGEAAWWAGLIRLGSIVVALILAGAFLVLVPRRRTVLTTLGSGTMYVYLLHSFVLFPLRETGLLAGLEPAHLWLPIVILGSILVSVVLATRPVQRLFRPLIEPRVSWLFRPSTTVAPTTGALESLPRVAPPVEPPTRSS